jgi:hypothetical protein
VVPHAERHHVGEFEARVELSELYEFTHYVICRVRKLNRESRKESTKPFNPILQFVNLPVEKFTKIRLWRRSINLSGSVADVATIIH